jgi:hypothetical protein
LALKLHGGNVGHHAVTLPRTQPVLKAGRPTYQREDKNANEKKFVREKFREKKNLEQEIRRAEIQQ